MTSAFSGSFILSDSITTSRRGTTTWITSLFNRNVFCTCALRFALKSTVTLQRCVRVYPTNDCWFSAFAFRPVTVPGERHELSTQIGSPLPTSTKYMLVGQAQYWDSKRYLAQTILSHPAHWQPSFHTKTLKHVFLVRNIKSFPSDIAFCRL